MDDVAVEKACGKWMPRAKTTCGRNPGHKSDCRTAATLVDKRKPKTERKRGVRKTGYVVDPAKQAIWGRKHRLNRYGLTGDQFEQLLIGQDHVCAMCHQPFGDDTVCIDHDHACCPSEKRSCGKCVRGLLCVQCNVALGYIERHRNYAALYLIDPPAKRLRVA
jgi:hypothetical protein